MVIVISEDDEVVVVFGAAATVSVSAAGAFAVSFEEPQAIDKRVINNGEMMSDFIDFLNCKTKVRPIKVRKMGELLV